MTHLTLCEETKDNGSYGVHKTQREIHRQHQGREDRRHGGDRREPRPSGPAPWWTPNPLTTALMAVALLAWTDATLVAVIFFLVAVLSFLARIVHHVAQD